MTQCRSSDLSSLLASKQGKKLSQFGQCIFIHGSTPDEVIQDVYLHQCVVATPLSSEAKNVQGFNWDTSQPFINFKSSCN